MTDPTWTTTATCSECGQLWRTHGSGGDCPVNSEEIRTWKPAHQHEVFTRGLWTLTTDDSQDEPPDFECNDGMDE